MSDSENRFSSRLQELHDELTELTTKTYAIYKMAKQIRKSDLYTSSFTLRSKVSNYFQAEKVSVEEILSRWTPVWKEEGRLGLSGKTITLNKQEASLLHLAEGDTVDVYELCKRMTVYLFH